MLLFNLFKELFRVTFQFFTGFLTDLVLGWVFPPSAE
jgi:hypothetical protein